MSSDLLAEFDAFYRSPQDGQSNATSAPASNDLSFLNDTPGREQAGTFQQWQNPPPLAWENTAGSQTSTQRPVVAQDDIWGSFETAGDARKSQPRQTTTVASTYGGPAFPGIVQSVASRQKHAIVRRPTNELFCSTTHGAGESVPPQNSSNPQSLLPQRPPVATKSSYGEVLFDADDEPADDDDDFGEFESVAPESLSQAQTQPSLNSMFGATSLESKPAKRPKDLLSTSTNGILPYPQAPKSPSYQERNPFAELGLSTNPNPISSTKQDEKQKPTSPVTAWPTFEPKKPQPNPYQDSPVPINQVEDEWGGFADQTPAIPANQFPQSGSGIEADAWAWDTADQIVEAAPTQTDIPPPINIPPPSVLLALFPSIFDLPQSSLFKPIANQPFSLKNRIMSDPSTVEFLRAYLLIATVAGRVIAGRKLRWKRDTLLSQAMKIGQAVAGGKSGMKLTGVDKAEITREDREAAEVVRVWKEQLGRLRSAIAVANSSIHNSSQHLAIPDVSEAMHVKTQERGLTAPKPCLICGLKREERVNKVDNDVEDSFGEWWVDHWGHHACRNFWLEHEKKLNRR